MFDEIEEKIVCAALKKDNHIVLGIRHYDVLMKNQFLLYYSDNNAGLFPKESHKYEQGFITNLYRFVDRYEAWKIAKTAKQLCWGKDREDGMLFSEDLY